MGRPAGAFPDNGRATSNNAGRRPQHASQTVVLDGHGAHHPCRPCATCVYVGDWHGAVVPCRHCPGAAGEGLAIPMLRQIIREAFRFPTITRLELNVYAGNAPAQKTYQKLGFQQEHTQRATIQVNGTYWDTVRMSMQRPTR
ncbi:hypothetical protein ASN_948 [Acetobacter senegalensis]|uniref:N-acetyltransferase domain-containing protein n=1 Tax=Acetobacter senegalensis TaxID=446692 RepID=A0A0U5ERY3_9PROT|nr:GNAT family protein [Acetobacter senegalensis]CEF40347.1 hypothetical protein ASN_948 [Acetobacter senegalensis]